MKGNRNLVHLVNEAPREERHGEIAKRDEETENPQELVQKSPPERPYSLTDLPHAAQKSVCESDTVSGRAQRGKQQKEQDKEAKREKEEDEALAKIRDSTLSKLKREATETIEKESRKQRLASELSVLLQITHDPTLTERIIQMVMAGMGFVDVSTKFGKCTGPQYKRECPWDDEYKKVPFSTGTYCNHEDMLQHYLCTNCLTARLHHQPGDSMEKTIRKKERLSRFLEGHCPIKDCQGKLVNEVKVPPPPALSPPDSPSSSSKSSALTP